MKPFNIEEAKAGKPVQDIHGTPVEILKYDLKNTAWPLVGVCATEDGREYVTPFSANELFMAPEEKTLYLNIYPYLEIVAYKTQKSANNAANTKRIACVKITYTEGQIDE